ncbi:MAG TPA: hypothetical protein ENI56_00795, partial [Candidatus Kaiserbacteria bacterium]|nr:hypothetical protein [Candidatus Kaiserbacteria bacterium]
MPELLREHTLQYFLPHRCLFRLRNILWSAVDANKNIIIGISGTIGAGKGAIVGFLKRKYSFQHFSGRDFITRELDRRKLPPTRDNMKTVANELRARHTPSYIA